MTFDFLILDLSCQLQSNLIYINML
jgi:hypothetical protein